MANSDLIRTGTASVDKGSQTVTCAGAALGSVLEGDFFGAHVGLQVPIQSVVGNVITLAYPWPGPSQTNAPYAIQPKGDPTRFGQRVRTLLEQVTGGDLAAIAALDSAADKMLFATGEGTWDLTTLTPSARTLLDDPTIAEMRKTLSVKSANESGLLAGFRNKVINGACFISQRGTSFNIAPGGLAYTADCMLVYNTTNQTVNVQTNAWMPYAGSGKHGRLRISFATAPTSGKVIVLHRIEGADTLAGKKVTHSFAAASAEQLVAETYLNQLFGSGGSAQTNSVPVFKSTNLPTDASVGVIKNTFDLPSTEGKVFGTNDYLEWAAAFPIRSTNPLTLTRLSLVEGDATGEDDPYQPMPYEPLLALCQRRYQRISYDLAQTKMVVSTNAANGNVTLLEQALPVPMRIDPTVSAAWLTDANYFTNSGSQAGKWWFVATAQAYVGKSGTVAIATYGRQNRMFICFYGATFTPVPNVIVHDPSLFFGLDAEL